MIRRLMILVVLCCFAVVPAFAQTEAPPQQAEAIRQALFDAQIALMEGESAAALEDVQQAAATAESAFGAFDADTRTRLDELFAQLEGAVEAGSAGEFASLRSAVWTTLLQGAVAAAA